MGIGPTQLIAEYLVKTSFDDLPDQVISQVKKCITDSLGCGFGGYRTEIGKIVTEISGYIGGKPQSTVIGSGDKTSSVMAAFSNSTMSNALDIDDTFLGHPGATSVHPAIAVGEMMKSSGRDLITAISAGYEITMRLADSLLPSPERIWEVRGIGTFQTFGAAAVTCKLLNLEKEKVLNALGIAGANAPVPSVAKTVHTPLGVTMVKNNFGVASAVGVLAGLLAQRGFTGPKDILDGDRGFWRMYGSDRCDFRRMTEKLGEEYEIMNVEFKRYPACRGFHSALDAAANIIREHKIDTRKINRITVRLPSILVMPPFNNPNPKKMLDAEFSIPHAIAATISGVEPGPDWFARKMFKDRDLLNIKKRVKLVADPEADKEYPRSRIQKVEISAQGKKHVYQVEFAKGGPRNSMTTAEFENKFKILASPVVGSKKARMLMKVINRLDGKEDATKLAGLLAQTRTRSGERS